MQKKEGASDSKHSWFLGSFQSQFISVLIIIVCLRKVQIG